MKRLQKLTLKLALLSSLIFYSPSAQACGGFFCTLSQPVDQAGERILFIKDGEDIVAHVQIQYVGESQDFSWVVPVPSQPTLAVGSDQLFSTLSNATVPSFNLDIQRTEGHCKKRAEPAPCITCSFSEVQESAADDGVTIVSQESVGPFETVVLTGDDPEKLKAWLKDNGYDIPPTLDPLLNPYIEKKMFLVALKLKKDRGSGDLQPIVMRYKADMPMIPLQLTAVAATPDMPVSAWILGNSRAIPENYKHVEINEAAIDWLNNGSNYNQVVNQAVDEAGGRAFVTNYAGKSSVVNVDSFTLNESELSILRNNSDPITFVETISRLNLFPNSTQLVAFLKRHIKKPDSLVAVEDSEYYRFIDNYATDIRVNKIFVDNTKAMNELEETIIKPFNNIKRHFNNHPYLTALYSTLSPEEMTVDPSFNFNADLPEVSNNRQATGVRLCSKEYFENEAPIRVTLKNKVQFVVTNLSSRGSSTELGLPSAERVEQLNPSGQAVVESDNLSKITSSVKIKNDQLVSFQAGEPMLVNSNELNKDNSPPGFVETVGSACACQNPTEPMPFEKGSEEGLLYAMMFMGWLGFKRRK